MPKVLCTLPNASELISGVRFVSHPNGMLSEDVSDEVAKGFAAIKGYQLVGGVDPAAEAEKAAAQEAAAKAAAEAEKAELLTRAAALDFKVKANWSVERLRSEVEAAAKAATVTQE